MNPTVLEVLATLCCLELLIIAVQGAVLDPALFLLPSPPLMASSDSISPGERWTRPVRVTREADDRSSASKESTTEEAESMEKAETFWPRLRTTSYGLRGIHIPMTFSISGTYGSGGYGTGVIGSSYASVSDGNDGSANTFGGSAHTFGGYGKSALAGSSYGSYGSGYPGVRIFGSSGSTGWSGWGNGKWGHYGKG